MHTDDATDRNASAEWRGKNGQWYRRAHELGARELGARDVGDAFELDTAPCVRSTQPQWPICGGRGQLYRHRQHHGHRYDEGEDALGDVWRASGARN